jgi:hypothetical protein
MTALIRTVVMLLACLSGVLCSGQPRLSAQAGPSGCGDLIKRLVQPPQSGKTEPQGVCAAADDISRQSPLEITRDTWDPALRERVLFVRCSHPGHCLPFLVRLRSSHIQKSRGGTENADMKAASANSLIRMGQRATLVWEQDGIRSIVPVICLDRGSAGQEVRVRVAQPNGKIVLAVIVSSVLLRNP